MLKISEEDLKFLLEKSSNPCSICELDGQHECAYCDDGWEYVYDENKWNDIVKKYKDGE